MNKIELPLGDVYVSEQIIREKYIFDPECHFEENMDHFFGDRPLFRKYIEEYGKNYGLDRIALLEAHGESKNKWVFYDGNSGEIELPVQRWINSVDGKYAGLLLCVCNSGSHTPTSKRSTLVVPDTTINFGVIREHDIIFDLIVPNIGEITSYTVEYELKRLAHSKTS